MTHGTKLDPIYTGKQTQLQANWYAERKDDPSLKRKIKRNQQSKERERKYSG